MKKLVNKFLFENVNTLKIDVIIKTISVFGVIKTLLILPDLKFIGEFGLIKGAVNSRHIFNYQPVFNLFYKPFSYLGISENVAFLIFGVLLIISLLCVFFNHKRVTFAILSWFIHFMFINSTYLFSYGADYFTTFILFINILFCITYNFNSLRQKNIFSFLIRFLQIHLCIVYFYAGLGKALGTSWLDGNAIWYVVNGFMSNSIIESTIPLVKSPLIFIIICWGTISIELLYPILIFLKSTRKIALYLILCMHLSIGVFMELYIFGIIMMLINIIGFGHYLKEDFLTITTFNLKKAKAIV